MNEFWQECIQQLSKEVPAAQVKQWLMPLTPIGFNEDETEFHLSAPSVLKQKWAQQYYAPMIQQMIKEMFSHDVEVVVLAPKPEGTATDQESKTSSAKQTEEATQTTEAQGEGDTPVETPVVQQSSPSLQASRPKYATALERAEAIAATQQQKNNNSQQTASQSSTKTADTASVEELISSTSDIEVQEGLTVEDLVASSILASVPSSQGTTALDISPSLKGAYEMTKLNPSHTFTNLVIGHSNELAHATAVNVVRHIGQQGYNPLFLYGSTGLGKTHLMHAIGNELFRNGAKRVRYIHANDYYIEMAEKMRRGDWLDYRIQNMKEYESLDLLLIDDIQFFKNKERTQQEFFYLYDSMVNKNKQVVISSDTYPRELADIDERLISRFSSGLTIQIEPPELEMRVAILMKKAESNPNIVLSDEAAFFIAKHIRSNVRELEGGLQRVIAYAAFHQDKEITVDICKDALRDLLRVANGLITVENIQKTVADFYKIRVSEIYSKSRKANIVRARHIAMYLAKELTRKSLPDLGEAFGGRDHSTVHHAVEKITELRASDRELNHELHVLAQTLKG